MNMCPVWNRFQRNALLTYIVLYVQECDTDTLQSGTRNGSKVHISSCILFMRSGIVQSTQWLATAGRPGF